MTEKRSAQSEPDAQANRYGTGDIIGGTFWTAGSRRDKAFNDYYSRVYSEIVERMLENEQRGSAFDVGTSHGVWY